MHHPREKFHPNFVFSADCCPRVEIGRDEPRIFAPLRPVLFGAFSNGCQVSTGLTPARHEGLRTAGPAHVSSRYRRRGPRRHPTREIGARRSFEHVTRATMAPLADIEVRRPALRTSLSSRPPDIQHLHDASPLISDVCAFPRPPPLVSSPSCRCRGASVRFQNAQTTSSASARSSPTTCCR